MKFVSFVTVMLFFSAALKAREVAIQVDPAAGVVGETAAAELAKFVGEVHPSDKFVVKPRGGGAPAAGTIQLVLDPEMPGAQPGEFRVSTVPTSGGEAGEIRAATPKALLDGVYATLERAHGVGFYLSRTAHESARGGPFSFEGWDFTDWPLAEERGIMAWPNFLSGCSTWSREEWLDFVRRAARMRATHILLHTYANDPLLGFELNGHERPVGWINSTRKGRTYAVEHITDVRNIPGAEGLFQEAWFGAEAAKVPDDKRVAASRDQMRAVFEEAHRFGLKTVWAIDVDTAEAHPQPMIEAVLQPGEITKRGSTRLINPESPGGYAWHKQFLKTITAAIPAIDRLVIWVRAPHMSPVMDLASGELPEAWRADLEARTAGLDQKSAEAGIYYASRVHAAWQRALAELGRDDIEIGFGSWTWAEDKFSVAHRVFPPAAPFYLKDYANAVGSGSAKNRERWSAIGAQRKLTPIAYVHHDDGRQCGPPLGLPQDLPGNLEAMKFNGLAGVIWLTRPLDIYFRSAWDRLWESGKSLTHADACKRMAADTVGPDAADEFAKFLQAWSTKGKTFGRETEEQFAPLDRGKKRTETSDDNAGKEVEKLVAEVDREQAASRPHLEAAAKLAATPEAKAHIACFRHYLDWVRLFFAAQAIRAAGDPDALAKRPETDAVRAFSQAALALGPTAGERGQVASLAARWMTFFTEKRQNLGIEPLRMRFMPTNHDPLARKPGTMTFHFDSGGAAWIALGQKETGLEAGIDADMADGLDHGWISAEGTLAVAATDVRGGTTVPAGRYHLVLHFPRAWRNEAAAVRVRAGGQDLGIVNPGANNGVARLGTQIELETPGELPVRLEGQAGSTVALSALELIPQRAETPGH